MYNEPYQRRYTPRGSWRTGRGGTRYWSERVKVDPNRVFDRELGVWRLKTEDEHYMEVVIPVAVPKPPTSQHNRTVAASSSDFGALLQARQPHLMSTADLLRERYSGVSAYPGRVADILSELERRNVHDPEGLAIRWNII